MKPRVGFNALANTECIQIAWKNFRSEFPTPKNKEEVNINICSRELYFRGSLLVHPNSVLWIFVCGDTKTLVHSAPIENVETLHQHICVPDKPFATTPAPLKGCDSP